MQDYKYKGIPLTTAIMAELALQYVKDRRVPVKRDDILKYVVSEHESRGGGKGGANPEKKLTHALNGLVEDGKLLRPTSGYYRAENLAEEAVAPPDAETVSLLVEDDQLYPREKIGEGDEIVYLYSNSSDEKLAGYENKEYWPCKIGYTAGRLTSRLLAQGAMTSIAYAPIVGLVISTDDGRSLEKAIHTALDQAGARIDGKFGTEWFLTSPQRIKDWYQAYKHATEALMVSAADISE